MTMVNAAPAVDDKGIQDISRVQIPTASRPAPQHLPKWYTWAQMGPTDEQLLVGVERENIYGSETFRMGSPYATHATLFANAANAEANACIYKRLIPEDAGPRSNLTLWLDVLRTTVDLYRRNADGSIFTDALGDPEVVGTTEGYKVKWVVTSRDSHGGKEISRLAARDSGAVEEVGGYSMTTGNQVDPVTGTRSERYPIFDFVVYSQGAYGNQLGVRMWTLNSNVSSIPYDMMNRYKAFPYMLSFVKRETPTSAAEPIKTVFGEQAVMVTLKPEVKDPVTSQDLYLGDRAVASFGNLTDPRYPIEFPPFGQVHIYQKFIDQLTEAFHETEIPFIDQFSDFSSSREDSGLFNFVTGQSSFGVPYHSFIFSSEADAVTFSKYTDVPAAGGSDGTMNDETFAAAVSKEVLRYRDRKDEVQDLAYHIESIMYDSGFPMKEKMDMISFISQRHDTFVVLGTHTFGKPALTESQEYSVAATLRARVLDYPESDYFGTPATRAMIMGCSGVIRNTKYRVPATFEVLIKFARYMGASNGIWKNDSKPDGNPGNVVEQLIDLNMVFVPETVRNRFWDVGLNWIQRYDRETFFIPAYRTVYPDDTSVLTSAITVQGVTTLNKIGHKCWRTYTGVSYLTNLQLCERVNNFVANEVKGIFDNRFVIRPMATVTDMDEAAGFKWTLPIGIGAAGMKTVQTLYVQSDRIERMRAE